MNNQPPPKPPINANSAVPPYAAQYPPPHLYYSYYPGYPTTSAASSSAAPVPYPPQIPYPPYYPYQAYPPYGAAYGAAPIPPAPPVNPYSVPPPPLPLQPAANKTAGPDAQPYARSRDHDRHGKRSPSRHRERDSRRSYSRYNRSRSRDKRSRSRDRRSRSREKRSRSRERSHHQRRRSYVSPPSKRSRRSPEARKRPLSPARGPSRKPTSGTFEDREQLVKDHMKLSTEEILKEEKKVWTRSAPADLYYQRDLSRPNISKATDRLTCLLDEFENVILKKSEEARLKYPAYEPPKISRLKVATCRPSRGCCGTGAHGKNAAKKANGSNSSSSSEEDEENDNEDLKDRDLKDETSEWLEHRSKQPFRLHPELWDNQPNELNDGPACRCSVKARKIGIRHGIYQGEDKLPKVHLDPESNNADKLYHYRIAISPPTNFLVKRPTTINFDEHEFVFEGFSMFTTQKLSDLPVCNVVRFSIKYSILYLEEKMPDNVTLRELQMFHNYFFNDLLELHDWDVQNRFFFMPRFVRDLPENGKEILSMNVIMSYLLKSFEPVVDEMDLLRYIEMDQLDWQNNITEQVKGMLVTNPGMRPGAVRVDQLDRAQDDSSVIKYPEIVHFGTRPQQLCYAGNADYQKVWREYIKFRHLLSNMPKPSYKDKRNIEVMEEKLNEMRANIKMKREVAVAVSSQGFYKTGLRTDIVQHGLLLPVLVNHLRLHASLDYFEDSIGYKFKNRGLLQLAMTHPSYKENYGTNPDHSRNTLSNCGMRDPEYGDRRVHSAFNRKRGINMLINIMSRFGKDSETESKIAHNERLEFLGDAVVEFVTSVHLYHMFPDLEEGGLATYRAALVQNQHLAILAEVLGLEKYMLYAHGSDLCHDSELRHAMANCFEALMGAIYLDGGIDEADKVYAHALFGAEPSLHDTWTHFDPHPLQMQEPGGDRHWIQAYPVLQKVVEFEKKIGIEFTHVRLLARSLSDRSLGSSNLTMGSNQRMEFLGDTVLQLVTSDYLYKHFPEHHEGHLSLLRSSIVNNRTQAVVCDDLGIAEYALFAVPKKDMKIKDKADLLEAFLGALYVDKDLEYCRTFAAVCFFPRLQQFIVNQEWNDPKSKLQQCCLTLRTMDGSDPDIPVYKVIESKGPTNTRVYSVAVYFKGERLAKAEGPSIQMAEMNAAKLALETCSHLFPHLDYQKKIVERSLRRNKDHLKMTWEEEVRKKRKEMGLDIINEECSRRNSERLSKIVSKKTILETPVESTQKIDDSIAYQTLDKPIEQEVVADPPCQPKKKAAKLDVIVPESNYVKPESSQVIEENSNNDEHEQVVVKNEPREEGECSDDDD